jgi:maltose alpha-D-glucosyltransferase / alpha-amylase
MCSELKSPSTDVTHAEQLRAARWFGGKSRAIRATRVIDRACWAPDASVCLVDVHYVNGPSETYVLADHFDDPSTARALLAHFDGSTIVTEAGGSLSFRPTRRLDTIDRDHLEPIRPLKGEQSNSSIRFGQALILKLFRRVQFGPNPDVEVGRFLTEHTSFCGTPPVAGSLTYLSADGREADLALLQEFEPNRGDAWTTMLARVREVLNGGAFEDSVSALARLGQTTADLHLALSSGTGHFGPELIVDNDVTDWRQAIHAEVEAAAAALAQRGINVDHTRLLERADGIDGLQGALKTRHHGDYHLGQVLERDDGAFVIIDFEGEPAKPLTQRREKRSPLRDVAGLLRSLDYARNSALRAHGSATDDVMRRAEAWYSAARAAFLDAYLARAQLHPNLIPKHVEAPLAALELEKAAYEVLYELNNRPDWLPIPLAALTSSNP